MRKNLHISKKCCTFALDFGRIPERYQKVTQLETQKFRDYEQDLQNCIIRKVRDECYQH